jgi:uncharacterized membrane protein YfcA
MEVGFGVVHLRSAGAEERLARAFDDIVKSGRTHLQDAVPLTLVAGLGHAAAGVFDWKLLVALLVGSLPGIWLGSALSRKIPERVLRTALAAMLVLIGGKLAW